LIELLVKKVKFP